MPKISLSRQVKVISATGRPDKPDDPSMPYKLEMSLSPPEFMQVTFVLLYGGSEDVVIRATSRRAIERLITKNDYRTHPRLRRLTLTGPQGVIEHLGR